MFHVLFIFIPGECCHWYRGDHLVVGGLLGARALLARRQCGEPRVYQYILGCQSLRRILSEKTPDQTLGLGRNAVRKVEVTPPDFGEKTGVFLPVEWIPEKQKENCC